MILGNKCDMEDKRVVSKERGDAIAREHNLRFLETSAKTNINIDKAFVELAETILEKMLEALNPPRPSGGHQLGRDDGRRKNLMDWLSRCSIL